MSTTIEQRQAIAFLVNGIRPDWDRPGIERALARANPEADAYALALAALHAAKHRTDQATPAVIAMSGSHWSTGDGDAGRAAVPTWRDPFPEEEALRDGARIAEIVRPLRQLVHQVAETTELPE